MADQEQQAYESYRKFCERIGIEPTDFLTWRKNAHQASPHNYPIEWKRS